MINPARARLAELEHDCQFLRELLATLNNALATERPVCDPGRNPVIRETSLRVEFTKTFSEE